MTADDVINKFLISVIIKKYKNYILKYKRKS